MSVTNPPNERPILVQAAPSGSSFKPVGGGKDKTSRPTRERQAERLNDRFSELTRLLSGDIDVVATAGIPDSDPELVVVFEVVDSTVDLNEAFKKVGMEPLSDLEDELSEQTTGSDFERLKEATGPDDVVKKFVHAAMVNQLAVEQLLKLWKHWKTGARMISGFGDFTQLFKKLHDIRPWGPSDRVRNTGLAELLDEQIGGGFAEVPVNVELWYRSDSRSREAAEQRVSAVVQNMGGVIHKTATHGSIGFHGIAATLPVQSLDEVRSSAELTELEQIGLLRTPEVLFVRPGGQAAVVSDQSLSLPPTTSAGPISDSGPPLLGILDGLPATNHPLIRERVEIVDPDLISDSSEYTVERRRHGTMVASNVIWGDLNNEERPLNRKVAIRPLLRPDLKTANQSEGIPWTELPADLMIRSVRDVLAEFPSVQVFCVALGDPLAQFDTMPGAWARSLDWLASELNVLFVVSAGNHTRPISLDGTDLTNLSGEDRDLKVAELLRSLETRRRLLQPAESMNALTIGSIDDDQAGPVTTGGYQVELWSSAGHPSPTSAHGRGVRRSLKPDLAAPGGRMLFNIMPTSDSGDVAKPVFASGRPPGVKVAAPPDAAAYASGSTFAAAETARRAAQIVSHLAEPATYIKPEFRPVATKALLVHGTADGPAPRLDRMNGHGNIERSYTEGCPVNSATLVYTGEIAAREAIKFAVPLPNEVAGLVAVRRVAVTLAWFTPINWRHRQYRRAKLVVDGPTEIPNRIRDVAGPEHQLSQRGTVQHREFETRKALTADQMTFTVKCFDQAGGLDGPVRFALAVTIECGVTTGIPVYDLVRERLQTQIRATEEDS